MAESRSYLIYTFAASGKDMSSVLIAGLTRGVLEIYPLMR
jgi:hypothetical protein